MSLRSRDRIGAPRSAESGFTLVEVMITILIVAILAVIAVPQFENATFRAREEALRRNLYVLRGSIERYYHQHGGSFPGCRDYTDGSVAADDSERATSFIYQLTYPSNAVGQVNPAQAGRDPGYDYGPYLLGARMPSNPLPEPDGSVDYPALAYVVDSDSPIAADAAAATTGWKFNCQTGQLIANSDETSSDGVTRYEDWGNNLAGMGVPGK
ncbi:MAG: type II secretion system protein [Myxococcales bacterium]|nr:type II secretion system protein [Myxococcales bacterium]